MVLTGRLDGRGVCQIGVEVYRPELMETKDAYVVVRLC